jgi:hypothetical protein
MRQVLGEMFLPLPLQHLQVSAGTLALAGADVITILIYLNLARWLLG